MRPADVVLSSARSSATETLISQAGAMTLQAGSERARTPSEQYEAVIDDLAKQLEPVESAAREPFKGKVHYSRTLGPLLFRHLCEVANTTSTLISPLVQADYCTVTIKLLWWRRNTTVVHTLLRDARSYRQRGSYQPADYFVPRDNTAFDELVQADDPDKLYLANNLRFDAAAGNYLNANLRWREFYNSTAVMRINRPDDKKVIIGFLCADAWAWNAKAEPKPVAEVLLKIAQHVYNTLELIIPENAAGKKQFGFERKNGVLAPIDDAFQTEFQATLEAFRKSFDNDFNEREAREESRLLGPGHLDLPASSQESEMRSDKDLRAMLADASNSPRVRKLREYLNKMTPQEFADRLEPIARHNRYAKELLAQARKKKLVK
jgi:hypothetical protein